ncbi:MAG: hypothetical protein ACPGRX_04070 [Bdellovibrionales bacterium]
MPDRKQSAKDEKFFFHMHVFDDDAEEDEEMIEEALPPPPPTFSEDELEAARQAGFADGHAAGLEESQKSRSQAVAALLKTIGEQAGLLFTQEEQRERRYEGDVLTLTLAIFEKLFPLYQSRFGFDELQAQIRDIVGAQNGHAEIEIRVAESITDAISAVIGKLCEKNSDLRLRVIGDAGFTEDQVTLSWADGGATRDAGAMAAQVCDKLKELLAGDRATSHDKEETISHMQDDPQTGPDTQEAPEAGDGAQE